MGVIFAHATRGRAAFQRPGDPAGRPLSNEMGPWGKEVGGAGGLGGVSSAPRHRNGPNKPLGACAPRHVCRGTYLTKHEHHEYVWKQTLPDPRFPSGLGPVGGRPHPVCDPKPATESRARPVSHLGLKQEQVVLQTSPPRVRYK